MENTKKKTGRKGFVAQWLEHDNLILIGQWARRGLTQEQIADNIGVSKNTICTWKKKYPQIAQALKKNKEQADAHVENELFERCHGKKVTVKRAFKVKRVEYDEQTGRKVREYEEIETADEEQYVPGDVGAMKYYLDNRCRKRWSSKSDVIPVPSVQKEEKTMTIEEKEALLREVMKIAGEKSILSFDGGQETVIGDEQNGESGNDENGE